MKRNSNDFFPPDRFDRITSNEAPRWHAIRNGRVWHGLLLGRGRIVRCNKGCASNPRWLHGWHQIKSYLQRPVSTHQLLLFCIFYSLVLFWLNCTISACSLIAWQHYLCIEPHATCKQKNRESAQLSKRAFVRSANRRKKSADDNKIERWRGVYHISEVMANR